MMPSEEATLSLRNQKIVIPSGTPVYVMVEIPDSFVEGGITTANLLGSIVGTIVGDYDLEMFKGL
jgi:hypothetical protein